MDAIDAKLSIFVQLKTSDSQKLGPNHMAFGVHRTSIASIRAALRQQWLASRIEESVIINGSGSYLGDGAIGSSASRPPVVMAKRVDGARIGHGTASFQTERILPLAIMRNE